MQYRVHRLVGIVDYLRTLPLGQKPSRIIVKPIPYRSVFSFSGGHRGDFNDLLDSLKSRIGKLLKGRDDQVQKALNKIGKLVTKKNGEDDKWQDTKAEILNSVLSKPSPSFDHRSVRHVSDTSSSRAVRVVSMLRSASTSSTTVPRENSRGIQFLDVMKAATLSVIQETFSIT